MPKLLDRGAQAMRQMCAGASLALLVAACGESEGLILGSCYHDKNGKALGDCVGNNDITLATLTFRDGEVKRAISQRLRDPTSARIDTWDVFMLDGTVPVLCGQVSGKNGFGGYGDPVSFVYSRPIGAVMRDDFPSNTEWRKTWDQLCTPPKALPINTVQPGTPTTGTRGESLWVTADGLNRRTCPSTHCGIVGRLSFREGAVVYERRETWARISEYYDASCVGGLSEFVDEGNADCEQANGIMGGKFAEWVGAEYLSETRPADPAANATGLAKALGSSDDFRTYEKAFVQAAQALIEQGRCREADFQEIGGWVKSVTTYRNEPVYFTYCGGMIVSNRIYLNAATGRLFQ